MATFANIITDALRELGETDAVFHTATTIQRYAQQAELLIALSRALSETTGLLTLAPGTPLYTIHPLFPRFIFPLRITIDGRVLKKGALSTLSRSNRKWFQTIDAPQEWFMIGATLLGFYPTPASSLTAEILFLEVPSTTTPSPTIDQDWHRAMVLYARAIALAKEAQIPRAMEVWQEFLAAAGIDRDPRHLEYQSSQRTAQQKARQQVTTPDD